MDEGNTVSKLSASYSLPNLATPLHRPVRWLTTVYSIWAIIDQLCHTISVDVKEMLSSKCPITTEPIKIIFHIWTGYHSNSITFWKYHGCLLNLLHSQGETLGDTKFSNFWFHGQKPKAWPFIGKLLSSTLLWCCLLTLWLTEWNLGWYKVF